MRIFVYFVIFVCFRDLKILIRKAYKKAKTFFIKEPFYCRQRAPFVPLKRLFNAIKEALYLIVCSKQNRVADITSATRTQL